MSLEFLTSAFSYEFLVNVWFVLWCVIWAVYVIADSFCLGAGMLVPIAAYDRRVRQLANTITPFWGGNQVWLILAAGGTFAAFPVIFARMFSWLYLPMMLLLIGLILRGLFVELVYHEKDEKLFNIFKWGWFAGSLLITVVLGVFFTNLFMGFPITVTGTEYTYTGTLLGLFSMKALLGALTFVVLYMTAGCFWVAHRADGQLRESTLSTGKKLAVASAVFALMLVISLFNTDGFAANYNEHVVLYAFPALAVICALATIALAFIKKTAEHPFYAFMTHMGLCGLAAATGLVTMYPFMMKSSTTIGTGLSIFDTASSHLTLALMFVAACAIVPIVIIYQLWAYTRFTEKVSEQ